MIRAGGYDHGEAVGLAQGSMEDDVVIHVLWGVVLDEAHETDLVVDDEQSRVVPVDPLELVPSDWVDTIISSVVIQRIGIREQTMQGSEEQGDEDGSQHSCCCGRGQKRRVLNRPCKRDLGVDGDSRTKTAQLLYREICELGGHHGVRNVTP